MFVVFALFAIVLAIFGVCQVVRGLNKSVGTAVAYSILMLIPLVNLVVLLVLNGQATKALKEHGYNVGVFGAA